MANDATPNPRARFVGVKVELHNLGPSPYEESPLSDAALFSAGGRAADPVTVLDGPCSGGFASHVKIPAGRTRAGCLAFEVAAGDRPVLFTFALDSGFADEKGTWHLR